jgi:hypothetical protein
MHTPYPGCTEKHQEASLQPDDRNEGRIGDCLSQYDRQRKNDRRGGVRRRAGETGVEGNGSGLHGLSKIPDQCPQRSCVNPWSCKTKTRWSINKAISHHLYVVIQVDRHNLLRIVNHPGVKTWWSIPFHSLDTRKKKNTSFALKLNSHMHSTPFPLFSPFPLLTPFPHPHPHPHAQTRLRVEIIANSALQPRGALAEQVGQVLDVVASRDAKLAHKVLCGALEVAVVVLGRVVFGPPEVRVG